VEEEIMSNDIELPPMSPWMLEDTRRDGMYAAAVRHYAIEAVRLDRAKRPDVEAMRRALEKIEMMYDYESSPVDNSMRLYDAACIARAALATAPQAQPAESPDTQQMADDLMRTGMAVSLGGKRIDPAEMYQSPDALDAARYRWLREKSAKYPEFYSGEPAWMVSREQGGMGQNFFGAKIDAAIDAAMKEQS